MPLITISEYKRGHNPAHYPCYGPAISICMGGWGTPAMGPAISICMGGKGCGGGGGSGYKWLVHNHYILLATDLIFHLSYSKTSVKQLLKNRQNKDLNDKW